MTLIAYRNFYFHRQFDFFDAGTIGNLFMDYLNSLL